MVTSKLQPRIHHFVQKVSTAMPMFSKSKYLMGEIARLYNQMGRSQKRKMQYGVLQTSNTHDSAFTHVINELPLVKHMFSGEGTGVDCARRGDQWTTTNNKRRKPPSFISLLSCVRVETNGFEVWRPPALIFSFRLLLTISPRVLLEWPSTNFGNCR